MDRQDEKALLRFVGEILRPGPERAGRLESHVQAAGSAADFFRQALLAGDLSRDDVAALADWYRVRDLAASGRIGSRLLTHAGRLMDESLDLLSSSEEGHAASPGLGRIPERFGTYRILAELGRGGMGIVYRAIDTALEREVALKVMAVGDRMDPTRLARFEREIEICGRLVHPNIVRIHAAGRQEDYVYYAMEYVDGTGLARWMATAPRDPMGRLPVLLPVVGALAHAHEQGVVHR
ncbi:MAG: serine/threonine protein kinase, partial [Planctomycetes bacterium]|nr:serine/threonine protein kinase [Planctomycetota bacterium]